MKVKTLLKKLDIELDSNDIVEPGLDETLKKGDSVTVKRVTTKKVKNIVTEEYETYYQANPSMTIGTMEVTQEGSNMSVYEVGQKAKNAFGLIESYDMTLEATVAKLMWILGQTSEADAVEELFYKTIGHDILWKAASR